MDPDSSSGETRKISKWHKKILLAVVFCVVIITIIIAVSFGDISTKVGFISIGAVFLILFVSSFSLLRYYNTHVLSKRRSPDDCLDSQSINNNPVERSRLLQQQGACVTAQPIGLLTLNSNGPIVAVEPPSYEEVTSQTDRVHVPDVMDDKPPSYDFVVSAN